jgi:hypothetical protein
MDLQTLGASFHNAIYSTVQPSGTPRVLRRFNVHNASIIPRLSFPLGFSAPLLYHIPLAYKQGKNVAS